MKKLFSILISTIMVCAMSMTAFAADGDAATSPKDSGVVGASTGAAVADGVTNDVNNGTNTTSFTYANDDDATAKATDTNRADVNVWAKVYDQTTGVYSLNIEWGNMKFAYKDTATVWDPTTHAYVPNASGSKEWTTATYLDGVNNKITVTNHSNAAVDAAFNYAMEPTIFNATDSTNTAVKGFFFDNNDKAKAAALILDNTTTVANTLANSKINLASAVGTAVESAPSGNVFFAFAGTPDVGKGAVLKDFTKVGVITVTISPVA